MSTAVTLSMRRSLMTVVHLGTLDTKGTECGILRGRLNDSLKIIEMEIAINAPASGRAMAENLAEQYRAWTEYLRLSNEEEGEEERSGLFTGPIPD